MVVVVVVVVAIACKPEHLLELLKGPPYCSLDGGQQSEAGA